MALIQRVTRVRSHAPSEQPAGASRSGRDRFARPGRGRPRPFVARSATGPSRRALPAMAVAI